MACLEFRKTYFWKTLIYATYFMPYEINVNEHVGNQTPIVFEQ